MNESKKVSTILLLLKILDFSCYVVVAMLAIGIHEDTGRVGVALMALGMGIVVIEATRFHTRHYTQLQDIGVDYGWLEEDHYSFSSQDWERMPQEVRDAIRKHGERG